MTIQMVWIAIGLGIAIGLLFLLLVWLARRQAAVSSLNNIADLLESIVTVKVPFERGTIGSVWLTHDDRRLVLRAKTRDERVFLRGDYAIVVEVEQAQVWVSHF